MKNFFKGMLSINLFPKEREPLNFKILSIQEAFKKSLEQVGANMYLAIEVVEKGLNK